jgi:ABC-type nitrate/sulfonate/bicarbonate transport system permease component
MRYSHSLHSVAHRHSLFNWRSSVFVVLLLFAFLIFLSLSGMVQIDQQMFFLGLSASFLRVIVAYVIALFLSIVIALAITSNSEVEDIFLPIFDVLQSFPSFALFPILVASLANRPNYVIVLVLTVTMIWPILFALISGIKGRRIDLEEAATVFGAKGSKRLFHFTLPMLFPSIVTGSIVGWGEGWEFIIGAELLVSVKYGVGGYLGQLGQANQGQALAYGIGLLLIFIFIVNKLIWLPLLRESTNFQSDT